MTRQPIMVDLFCGLGGWADGGLAEGYCVIGYDIERHEYGDMRYQGELVLQDVMTIHGSQFKDAALIVASPPCQEFSYMAMPWALGKSKAADIRADTTGAKMAALTALFDACFRIQCEASAAAGHHIPMVVENMRGAIPWVGRSRWNFGSFHLWGDVPALMPMTIGRNAMKAGVAHRGNGATNFHGHTGGNDGSRKVPGISWSNYGKPGYMAKSFTGTAAQRYRDATGTKIGGDWFSDPNSPSRRHGSKSPARKMASAMIAKIPLPLSRHIAAVYRPALYMDAAE